MIASIASIQRAVADHHGLPSTAMTSVSRCREWAWPRQEAMYLAKQLSPFSLTTLGHHFGHRHHTTVLHGIRAVEQRIRNDPQTRRALLAVGALLTPVHGDEPKSTIELTPERRD